MSKELITYEDHYGKFTVVGGDRIEPCKYKAVCCVGKVCELHNYKGYCSDYDYEVVRESDGE